MQLHVEYFSRKITFGFKCCMCTLHLLHSPSELIEVWFVCKDDLGPYNLKVRSIIRCAVPMI